MKLSKIWFLMIFIILTSGCGSEQTKINKIKEQNPSNSIFGQKIQHRFIKVDQGCKSQSPVSEWIGEKELKITLPVIMESRGSQFKQTKAFVKDQTIEIYILENFCQNNCPETSNVQCAQIYLDQIEKGSYNVNIHRVEELNPGGVIKKFQINAD